MPLSASRLHVHRIAKAALGNSLETHSGSMFEDSGDITTQALARSSSAAARIVRNATPLAGLFAYFVLIGCSRHK
jgi:hypothetical protein